MAIIARHVGSRDAARMGAHTTINHDLGVDGDDATDILLDIQREFEIADMSDLDAGRYFGPENSNPIHMVSNVVKWVVGTYRPLEPLSVEMLASYVRKKTGLCEQSGIERVRKRSGLRCAPSGLRAMPLAELGRGFVDVAGPIGREHAAPHIRVK